MSLVADDDVSASKRGATTIVLVDVDDFAAVVVDVGRTNADAGWTRSPSSRRGAATAATQSRIIRDDDEVGFLMILAFRFRSSGREWNKTK